MLVNLLRSVAPWLALALVCVVAWFAGYMHRGADESRRAAQTAAAVQVETDRRMAAALGAQQKVYEAQLRNLEARAQQRQLARTIIKEAAKDVADAPVTLDCVDSPAVGRAVDRLRELTATRAGRP